MRIRKSAILLCLGLLSAGCQAGGGASDAHRYIQSVIEQLEASTAYTEVEDLISSVKPLIYGKETWALKERYFQLPEAMRKELESIPYFREPFRNIPIIKELESENRP